VPKLVFPQFLGNNLKENSPTNGLNQPQRNGKKGRVWNLLEGEFLGLKPFEKKRKRKKGSS